MDNDITSIDHIELHWNRFKMMKRVIHVKMILMLQRISIILTDLSFVITRALIRDNELSIDELESMTPGIL